ncbi:NAD(P)-dependent oxidoreductase [uncultured Jannaschia sp.]|uniref:NAD(P)-dependent oxidoreductase n=1 Tax=uncultured Jannaschia sp. TaxID=293347 RepID=UPI00261C0A4F|nr:NAD(P)H-binding protein [uncultured Jannaschia sp.]
MTKTFLVYGADGATGLRIVRQGLAAGHTIRAGYHAGDPPDVTGPDVTWIKSDLMTRDGLEADLAGVDAVLNAVGIDAGPSTFVNPPPLHTEGTANLIEAMRATGVDRLVTISASFVETMARGPIWFQAAARLGLKSIFDQMAEMERILRATEQLRWTAVRPGWLLDEGPSGDYRVFDDVIPPELIRTRTGDLADFMLRCATEDLHIRGTPAIARKEPASKSGPDAVLAEMLG